MSASTSKSAACKLVPSTEMLQNIEVLGDITGIASESDVCLLALNTLRALLESDEFRGKITIKNVDGRWQVAPTIGDD